MLRPIEACMKYFVTFIDDHFRYRYIYLVNKKSKPYINLKKINLRWKLI